VPRDPALFLTGDQIAKILPIMNDLKASAFPTPSRAKTIQAGVDGVLTKAQKAAWEKLQKDLEKARADAPARQGAQGGRNFAAMTPEEQKQLLDRLPEDQRKAFQERMKAAQAEAKLTPEQRRLRQIERFIKELEDRAAELKKA
jgi:flagellum-specific peptidoglycan hydrolase FlgJ